MFPSPPAVLDRTWGKMVAMPSVWIVFEDETDLNMYGVFNNPEDAATYADEMEHLGVRNERVTGSV